MCIKGSSQEFRRSSLREAIEEHERYPGFTVFPKFFQ